MGGLRRRWPALICISTLVIRCYDAFVLDRPRHDTDFCSSSSPTIACSCAATPTESRQPSRDYAVKTQERRPISYGQNVKNPFRHCKDVTTALRIISQQNMTERLWTDAINVCIALRDHRAARQMLTQISRPNIRHYTAYLKVLLMESSRLAEGIDFLDHISGRGNATINNEIQQRDDATWQGLPPVPPNIITMRTVLGACQRNHTAAMYLLDGMKQGCYGDLVQYPDEACYNLVIASCPTPDQAKELVLEMRLTRRHRIGVAAPTARTITQALVICRRHCDVAMARFLIKQASMDGIKPDLYLYSAAIATATSAKDCLAARYFWNDMIVNKKLAPNVITYNSMLGAYTACGDIQAAISLFQQMKVPKTRTTFYYLAKSLFTIPDNVMKLVYLHSITDAMAADDWQVEIGGPVIETIISVYGALGCYADARSIYDKIVGPADAACLRAMLFACSTAQPHPEWQEALELLHTSDIMTGTQGPTYVDHMSVSHAMLACSKADEWEESLQLLRLYGDKRISILALNSLIGACGRAGRSDMAIEVLNEMETDLGIMPDTYSYRSAIIACNQAEHEQHRQDRRASHQRLGDKGSLEWWECSLSLLRRMWEQGLEPDIQSYSSVISACEAAGEWQHALTILQSVLDTADDNPSSMNLYCFNAAISACEKGGAWVEALEIYERMKAYGGQSLEPSIVTFGSLILAFDKAGQKELAQSTYEEGRASGAFSPWRTTTGPTGERLRSLDLHRFNTAMARTAVRSYLESLLAKGRQQSIEDDLVIIVGRGKHSTEEPVLAATVRRLLKAGYGINPTVDESNPGRIIIKSEELVSFVSRKSWR